MIDAPAEPVRAAGPSPRERRVEHPAGGRRTGRRMRQLRVAVVVAVLGTALSACGVRLETPAPVEPSPDAVEQVRARTVDDALALADAAGAAQASLATGADAGADPAAVTALLDEVSATSGLHAQELGGVYDSGLPQPTDSPTSPAPTTTTWTPAQVLALLVDGAATARRDAETVEDGPLARLVGSVGVARSELASRVSAAAGLPLPEATVSTVSTADADGTPTASAAPTTTPSVGPDDDAGGVPAGLASSDLSALVVAEDQAGYSFEVVAAVLAGDQRTQAQTAAAVHRARAEDWAVLAGTTGTVNDPRRVAYAVPAGIDDPAVATGLARDVQTTLADTYATMVARAEAGSRAALLDGLLAGTTDARTWGAAPVPFPGMPELAAAAQEGQAG